MLLLRVLVFFSDPNVVSMNVKHGFAVSRLRAKEIIESSTIIIIQIRSNVFQQSRKAL